MYEFDGLPLEPVAPGTNLLVTGPAMGGTRGLFFRMVAPRNDGEALVLVSTGSDAAATVESLEAAAGPVNRNLVGVVDAAGGSGAGGESGQVRSVGSPSDLTGIGTELTDLYEAFFEEGAGRVRTGVDSLSTLLLYTDVRTVFRFTHVLTGRVATADGLGVFAIDPSSHDERTTRTLNQLFDGRVDVREGESRPELRVRGLPDQPGEWTSF